MEIANIKTVHTSIIKKLFKILSNTVDDVRIDFIKENDDDDKHVNNGGLRLMALDELSTLLVFIKLKSETFEQFNVICNYSAKFEVNDDNFKEFINNIDDNSSMIISMNKNDENNIHFGSQDSLKYTQYKQPIIDDTSPCGLPRDTMFKINVIIDVNDLVAACNQISKFSKYVEIECCDEKITFSSTDKNKSYSVTYMKNIDNQNGVRIITLNSPIDDSSVVKEIYNMNDIVKTFDYGKLCSEIQLFLKNDYPMFVQYDIQSELKSIGKMLIGLSPISKYYLDNHYDYE